MSSPRDRDPFDDRSEDGSGWKEPAHLGDDDGAARQEPPAEPWQPPGWDLPATEPVRGEQPAPAEELPVERVPDQPPASGGGVVLDIVSPLGRGQACDGPRRSPVPGA